MPSELSSQVNGPEQFDRSPFPATTAIPTVGTMVARGAVAGPETQDAQVERIIQIAFDDQAPFPARPVLLTSRAHLLRGGASGPAVVAGKPQGSLLVRAVVRYQDTPRMPPKGKLTDRQIEVLARWVERGVPWPGSPATPPAADGRLRLTEQQRRFCIAGEPGERTPWPKT
jgi:hypothetical protein